MPEPRYRSRTLKRRDKRLPGDRTTTHYKLKKVSKSLCAVCKRPLAGVPRLHPSDLKKLPKGQRRPERPLGGYLCPKCLKEKIKEAVRGE